MIAAFNILIVNILLVGFSIMYNYVNRKSSKAVSKVNFKKTTNFSISSNCFGMNIAHWIKAVSFRHKSVTTNIKKP